ncbi:OLC1v1007418C1 [Oldenlandia corymbosa var. corymbosa]|uniref:OLC1v1007418C1 n=1 Tax=Oldenlandia corymbosa var. corymbosa TaxID=529605 RepID=A0AAV1DJL1_OLDCO|nr:OLC1v1007418C1 [Oldenlandia corymbosa var. corymbosa]
MARNYRLRGIYRSLSSNSGLLCRCKSTLTSASTQTNPPSQFIHDRTPEMLRSGSRLFFSTDFRRGECGVASLSRLNQRFLCSTASNVNQTKSSDATSEASSNSGTNESESSKDGSQKNSEQGKPIRGSPVSWMSFFLLLATGAALIWYYDREKKRHIEGINNASKTAKQGPSAGKAAIGGPFSLVDHNGKPVTEKSFLGKWTLIYFGFTFCPDICPVELEKLVSAIDKIKEKSGIEIVPVFISVDPERDTVEQVRAYVTEFHPNLIGLTGSVDEVKKAARAYRVYYMKTEEEGSDYLVDHSIVMYLMDPQMEFVKFFGKNNDDESLADGIIQQIKQRK